MFKIAKNLISSAGFMKILSINMGIRNIKPVIPKLVLDNPSKQDTLDYEFMQYLEYEQKLGPCSEYQEIIPGVYRTYPSLFPEEDQSANLDYELRSKRHRVAKLKRAKRKDGKRTHIQNN